MNICFTMRHSEILATSVVIWKYHPQYIILNCSGTFKSAKTSLIINTLYPNYDDSSKKSLCFKAKHTYREGKILIGYNAFWFIAWVVLAFRQRATGVIHGDISTHPSSHLLSVLFTNCGVLATLK